MGQCIKAPLVQTCDPQRGESGKVDSKGASIDQNVCEAGGDTRCVYEGPSVWPFETVPAGRACYNQSNPRSSAVAIGRKEAVMTTDTPSREQILVLARRLSPADQAYLVAQLAPAIAEALEAPVPSAGEDAWRRLDQLREEFRAMEPGPISMTEQLDRDRRERDAALRGESSDVHA
jgi:hypothetical protein